MRIILKITHSPNAPFWIGELTAVNAAASDPAGYIVLTRTEEGILLDYDCDDAEYSFRVALDDILRHASKL